jgi:DNA-binding MarR family transcriptional regulator
MSIMVEQAADAIPVDNIRTLLHYLVDGIDLKMASYRKGTRYERVRNSDVKVFILAQRGPKSISELAKVLGISRQAVHMSVRRLLALDVITLASTPGNAKEKTVLLTPRGEQAQTVAGQQVRDLEAECVEAIGATAFEDLRGQLVKLVQHFGRPQSQYVTKGHIEP